MKVGLFFGSFNPIHTGHLIIANVAFESTDLDQIWFVVSPQNPDKRNKNLLHEFDRIDLVREAIKNDDRFNACDVEFDMPRPSFTIDTLTVLTEKHPSYQFSLILGSDNLKHFYKWKNYEQILEHFRLVVYPRPNEMASEIQSHPSVHLIEAPMMDISATLIRKLIRSGKSIKYLVSDTVAEQIEAKRLYL